MKVGYARAIIRVTGSATFKGLGWECDFKITVFLQNMAIVTWSLKHTGN